MVRIRTNHERKERRNEKELWFYKRRKRENGGKSEVKERKGSNCYERSQWKSKG